jgi:hypothetical protein
MPPVLAQMRGNAVRARRFAEQGGGHGIGFAKAAPAIARFAEGGHVVNIDAKFEHVILTVIQPALMCQKCPEFAISIHAHRFGLHAK